MSTLRLAYLVSRYPAVSHTFILREILGLRRMGVEIDVASINDADRKPDALTEEERTEAARTYYVKAGSARGAVIAHWATLTKRPIAYLKGLCFALRLGGADLRRILFGLLYFVEAVMVGHWMRQKGVTHLHVHFATPAATVGMIATRVFPVTLSITVHGPDEFYDIPGYYLLQKIEACSFLCAISDYARSQLNRIVPESLWGKVEVTRLGVDPDVFRPRIAPDGSEPFEILCVGRLVAAKGQHVLVNAVASLQRQGRAVHARFVGDGPDRAALEARVQMLGLSDVVTFEGAVNQDRIRAFYQAADAFVLPSFAEGIPVVLMEAMAMEIPVVTTWITGVPELIENGRDGILVAPSSERGLVKAIGALMDDPEAASRLGKAGRGKVIEEYNLAISVGKLADVFHKRLDERTA